MFGILKGLFGGKSVEDVPSRKPPNPERIRRLRGDGAFSFKVAGTSKYQAAIKSTEKALGSNHSGDFIVSLIPDPKNKFDANAIKVVHKADLLGFVPGEQTSDIHAALSKAGLSGKECSAMARIVGHGKETLGLRLNISVPPRIS